MILEKKFLEKMFLEKIFFERMFNMLVILLIGIIVFINKYDNKIQEDYTIKLNEDKYDNSNSKEASLPLEEDKYEKYDENEDEDEDEKDRLTKYFGKRDRAVVEDYLIPPEKRMEQDKFTQVEFYKRTRGEPDNYQLMGILYNETENKTYQLFGRQTYPGSYLYEYYYRGKDAGGLDFKFPINGNKELRDGDTIKLPTDTILFTIKIYPNDYPRYDPYVI